MISTKYIIQTNKVNCLRKVVITLLVVAGFSLRYLVFAEILSIPSGVRPVSTGEAFSGMCGDINSINYNPAGLSSIEGKEFYFSHNKYLVGIDYEYMAFSYSLKDKSVIAGSIIHLYDTQTRYDIAGTEKGSFQNTNSVVSVAFAKRLNEILCIGGTLKGIFESYNNNNSQSVGFDTGVLYLKDKLDNPADKFGFGFVVQNINLPVTVRAGVSYKFSNKLFLFDLIKQTDKKNFDLSYGIEWYIKDTFSLRFGCKTQYGVSNPFNGRAGFGVKLENFDIEYVFLPFGELGNSHQLGFKVKW